jgi:hypothetical protein
MYPIASVVLSNNLSGVITFTNVPQNFTHLQARWFMRTIGSATYEGVYFNGDAGANNYYVHGLYGDGAGVGSVNSTNNQAAVFPATMPNSATTTNVFGEIICDILDYSSTSKNKTIKWFWGYDGNGAGMVGMSSAVWLNTSAINRLDFNAGNAFAAGTRIDLYGIQTSNATGA